MSLLVAFLPDQAFVLVFAGVGLALIVGLLSRRAAFNILGGVVLLLLLAPFELRHEHWAKPLRAERELYYA